MSDIIETPHGQIKIFSQNNGYYVIRRDSFFNALNCADEADIVLTFFDLFEAYNVERKLRDVYYLDLRLLVEDVLPTFLNDFADDYYDDIFLNAKNLLSVLSEQLEVYMAKEKITLPRVLNAIEPTEKVTAIPDGFTTPKAKKTDVDAKAEAPDVDELIKDLSVATGVQPILFAEIIANFKREKFEAKVDKRRAELHKEMEVFMEKFR